MATVDEEFRRQYRDVAPFNPTSKDRAHNTQQFIIFLQKMSQVQPLLRILVQATKPTFATPQTGDYDTYVNSLEDNQGAVFESHLLYLVSSKTAGVGAAAEAARAPPPWRTSSNRWTAPSVIP